MVEGGGVVGGGGSMGRRHDHGETSGVPTRGLRARGDQGTVREVGEFKQYTQACTPASHLITRLHTHCHIALICPSNILSFLYSFDTSLIHAGILSMGRKYTRYVFHG